MLNAGFHYEHTANEAQSIDRAIANVKRIKYRALEGLVAVAAGAVAGSISLVGFGIDNFIEVASGVAVLCECRSMLTFSTGREERNSGEAQFGFPPLQKLTRRL